MRINKQNSELYIWICYCAVLASVALFLNTFTVLLWIGVTLFLSLKKPIFAWTSILCALFANTYLANYGYLNAALCFVFIIPVFLNIKKIRKISAHELLVLFTFLYCVIISALSDYKGLFILVVLLISIIAARLMRRIDLISLPELVISMCITSIFSGVVGIRDNLYGLSYGIGSVSRFLSSYGDPNFYCMFSVVAAVGMLYSKSKKLKIFMVILISFFMVLTFSKSLLLLLGFNALVFLFRSDISKKRKVQLSIAMVLCVIFLNWILTTLYDRNIILNYAFRFTQEGYGNDSINVLTSGRSTIQLRFLEYFVTSQSWDKIIFGNGYIGTSSIASLLGLSVETTHMVYLQILFDFGIVGASLFLFIFVDGYRKAGKIQRQMLLTYFIAMLFLSWQYSVPFFPMYLLLYDNSSFGENYEQNCE